LRLLILLKFIGKPIIIKKIQLSEVQNVIRNLVKGRSNGAYPLNYSFIG